MHAVCTPYNLLQCWSDLSRPGYAGRPSHRKIPSHSMSLLGSSPFFGKEQRHRLLGTSSSCFSMLLFLLFCSSASLIGCQARYQPKLTRQIAPSHRVRRNATGCLQACILCARAEHGHAVVSYHMQAVFRYGIRSNFPYGKSSAALSASKGTYLSAQVQPCYCRGALYIDDVS
jgi:hypothetical protein